MHSIPDRILVVENDPLISDFLSRQTLQSAGYQVQVVNDVNVAIDKAIRWAPDLIIANIDLPGLSVKDMLVALSSQGAHSPVIVLAKRGSEASLMQTFRLGAADYLIWPSREAEVISAVERVLRQVHERKERDQLSQTLKQTNLELQHRVRELTTIFSIGKAVTSVTDSATLFEKIVEGSAKVSQADLGWFLLREDRGKNFILVAQKNLPASALSSMNQAWDDGISSLVALSGEPLAIQGEPIKRFKISSLGHSALIIPVKVQKQVIGLLVMMRKEARPFSEGDQNVLQAVADYASISLVNAHLFRAVEERARLQQQVAENAKAGEKINLEILERVRREMQQPLEIAYMAMQNLTKDPTARWNPNQRRQLTLLNEQLELLNRVADAVALSLIPPAETPLSEHCFDLTELVRRDLAPFQPFIQQNNLTLVMDLPNQPVMALGESAQVAQVLNGLLSNAVKFCNIGGRVTVRVEKTPNGLAHVSVEDTGVGIEDSLTERIFSGPEPSEKTQPRRFGGLGISLKLMKEIIQRQNGRIWIEKSAGQGAKIHFSLPAAS